MLKGLLANRELKERLEKALSEGHLPHGVLLCGEDGLGCGYAARLLAAEYLEPENELRYAQAAQGCHPECTEVIGTGAAGLIKVDQIRQVRAAMQETALSGTGRVVIIRDAHRMGAGAANALLKILEEPPEGVLFILTAPSAGAVLPTLLSRCGVYSLSTVPKEECIAAVREQFPSADGELLFAVFGGRLGKCLWAAQDPAPLEGAIEAAESAVKGDVYGLMCAFAPLEKDRPGAAERLQLLRFIAFAGVCGHRHPRLPAFSLPRAEALIGAVERAEAALAQNANLKLALTAFAARCGRIS